MADRHIAVQRGEDITFQPVAPWPLLWLNSASLMTVAALLTRMGNYLGQSVQAFWSAAELTAVDQADHVITPHRRVARTMQQVASAPPWNSAVPLPRRVHLGLPPPCNGNLPARATFTTDDRQHEDQKVLALEGPPRA